MEAQILQQAYNSWLDEITQDIAPTSSSKPFAKHWNSKPSNTRECVPRQRSLPALSLTKLARHHQHNKEENTRRRSKAGNHHYHHAQQQQQQPAPGLNQNQIQDAQLRRYQALVKSIQFQDCCGKTTSTKKSQNCLAPGAAFFKWLTPTLLSLSSSALMDIPPTLIRMSKGTFLYLELGHPHSVQYQVMRSLEKLRERQPQLMQKLLRLSGQYLTKSQDRACPERRQKEHLSHDFEHWMMDENFSDNHEEVRMLQSYVPPKGQQGAAWMVRTVYHKEQPNITAYVVSQANAELVDLDHLNEERCSIIKCSASHSWEKPKRLTQELLYLFETHYKLSFQTFVVDLIESSSSTWSLLQVKAFELTKRSAGVQHLKRVSNPLDLPLNTVVQVVVPRRRKTASEKQTAQVHKKCPGQFCNVSSSSSAHPHMNAQHEKAAHHRFAFKDLFIAHFTSMYCLQNQAWGEYKVDLEQHLIELPRRRKNQLYTQVTVCLNCASEYYRLKKVSLKMMQQQEHQDQDQTMPGSSQEEQEVDHDHRSNIVEEDPDEHRDHSDQELDDLENDLQQLEAMTTSSSFTALPDLVVLKSMPKEELKIEDHREPTLHQDQNVESTKSPDLEAQSFLSANKVPLVSKTHELALPDLVVLKSMPKEELKIEDHREPTLHQDQNVESTKSPDLEAQSFLSANKVPLVSKTHELNRLSEIWKTNMPKSNSSSSRAKGTLLASSPRDNLMSACLPEYDISITAAETIFFNETYQQEILREARQALECMNKVKLVVIPKKTVSGDQDKALVNAEMVLHTLFFELRDHVATERLPEIQFDADSETTTLTLCPL